MSHVIGNQIPTLTACGADGLPHRWLAGLLAWRLGQTAAVLRGHAGAGQKVIRVENRQNPGLIRLRTNASARRPRRLLEPQDYPVLALSCGRQQRYSPDMPHKVISLPSSDPPEKSRAMAERHTRLICNIGGKRYALDFWSRASEIKPGDSAVLPFPPRPPHRIKTVASRSRRAKGARVGS